MWFVSNLCIYFIWPVHCIWFPCFSTSFFPCFIEQFCLVLDRTTFKPGTQSTVHKRRWVKRDIAGGGPEWRLSRMESPGQEAISTRLEGGSVHRSLFSWIIFLVHDISTWQTLLLYHFPLFLTSNCAAFKFLLRWRPDDNTVEGLTQTRSSDLLSDANWRPVREQVLRVVVWVESVINIIQLYLELLQNQDETMSLLLPFTLKLNIFQGTRRS